MKKVIICCALSALFGSGCLEATPSSDAVQEKQQERMLKEGTSQVGMPAIKNFRERKLLKDIYELRDQNGLVTYTYMQSQYSGKLVFFCNSIGYGINDATGFTNPEKVMSDDAQVFGTMPQAEPNGLFTPDNANQYWVMCVDPKSGKALPVQSAVPLVTSPFALNQ